MSTHPWLEISRDDAPLIISLPHTGTDLCGLEPRLVSPWLARKDTDWWIDRLYDFAADLGATVVRTAVSRTVIDVNRDPGGMSLYPGQATTELCPSTTFDGEALYTDGQAPGAGEIADRRERFHVPYHQALAAETGRLRALHPAVVIYDCHSIRSNIPRLFDGELPHFNIGTNSGASCDAALAAEIEQIAASSGLSSVSNGRFKGGFITRSLGNPAAGVHAVQMELACRSYLREPAGPVGAAQWPVPFDAGYAAPVRVYLRRILDACLAFAAAAPGK